MPVKLKSWMQTNALTLRLQERKAKRQAREQAFQDALLDPEQPAYMKAVHHYQRYALGQNFIAFGKWLIKDLLWFLLPYVPYGQFQTTINMIVNYPGLNSKILWVTQQRLILFAIVTGAVLVVTLQQVIKNGWFHRRFNKARFTAFIDEQTLLAKNRQHEATAQKNRHALQHSRKLNRKK